MNSSLAAAATPTVSDDLVPERFYVYANLDYLGMKCFSPMQRITDPGVAMRPFERSMSGPAMK